MSKFSVGKDTITQDMILTISQTPSLSLCKNGLCQKGPGKQPFESIQCDYKVINIIAYSYHMLVICPELCSINV